MSETKAPNHMSQIQWFMRIKKGEKVVAYFNKTIRGIGEIIGDYELHENERYRHTRKVKWYDLTERKVPASVLESQPAAMAVQKFPKHCPRRYMRKTEITAAIKTGSRKATSYSPRIFIDALDRIEKRLCWLFPAY